MDVKKIKQWCLQNETQITKNIIYQSGGIMKSWDDVDIETINFYKNKFCVSFVNEDFIDQGVTKIVKAFDNYDEARKFCREKENEGVYCGFASMEYFPDEAIAVWLDMNKDSLLPTTRRN